MAFTLVPQPSDQGTSIQPGTTAALTAQCPWDEPPRVAYIRILPWHYEEFVAAKRRYARWPKPIQDWFMKKYDPFRQDCVGAVDLPAE